MKVGQIIIGRGLLNNVSLPFPANYPYFYIQQTDLNSDNPVVTLVQHKQTAAQKVCILKPTTRIHDFSK